MIFVVPSYARHIDATPGSVRKSQTTIYMNIKQLYIQSSVREGEGGEGVVVDNSVALTVSVRVGGCADGRV